MTSQPARSQSGNSQACDHSHFLQLAVGNCGRSSECPPQVKSSWRTTLLTAAVQLCTACAYVAAVVQMRSSGADDELRRVDAESSFSARAWQRVPLLWRELIVLSIPEADTRRAASLPSSPTQAAGICRTRRRSGAGRGQEPFPVAAWESFRSMVATASKFEPLCTVHDADPESGFFRSSAFRFEA
jgi:hypothetical protein